MRFHGAVGYSSSQEETSPGVWNDVIIERSYYGDVIRNSRRLEPPSAVPPMVNQNVTIENSFAIVGDAHAFGNFMNMKYIVWEGSRWTVTNVEPRRPRLILTVGGLWDGNTP